MTFEQAVSYIEDTPRFTKKHSVEHTRAFLEELGDPQNDMKIIHVAGTNGKGSVCAFLDSILRAAGKHTGLFTSPHLTDIRERFRVDGEQTGEQEFLSAFSAVMSCVERMEARGYEHPTYFELLFLIGMVYFSSEQVEYLVLETGLGGRLDATNSVEKPLVTVITSISYDHTEYLGDTLEAIAGEKAGIIKAGVPVVYEASGKEAEQVIRGRARELSAPAFAVRPDMYKILAASKKRIDFCLDTGYYDCINLAVSGAAQYQVQNAALAVTAVRLLPESGIFSDECIRSGVHDMYWEGRMESVLPGVILDGAHNEAGMREFAKSAVRISEGLSVTVLFAAVGDKDYRHMIEILCRYLSPDRVIVTEVGGSRSVSADLPVKCFRDCGVLNAAAVRDAEQAFDTALMEREEGILFCVGSLYLVGDIKKILKNRRLSE